MRKFLSSSAGASFHEETPNLTLCVRKECIEIITKVQPAVYAIICMFHSAQGMALALSPQKNPPFPAWKTDLDEVWN